MASANANLTKPAFLTTRTARILGWALAVAEVVAHVLRLVALAIVDVPSGYAVTHPAMLTVAAAVGALGAGVAYLLLERWTRRASRWLVIVATLVLVLSFGSVTQLQTMFPEASAAALALSPLLHIAVATTSVATVLRQARTR